MLQSGLQEEFYIELLLIFIDPDAKKFNAWCRFNRQWRRRAIRWILGSNL